MTRYANSEILDPLEIDLSPKYIPFSSTDHPGWGNPALEAESLRVPLEINQRDFYELMRVQPDFPLERQRLSPNDRSALVKRLRDLFVPQIHHWDTWKAVRDVIERSMIERNPADPSYIPSSMRNLAALKDELEDRYVKSTQLSIIQDASAKSLSAREQMMARLKTRERNTSAKIFALTGVNGVGKTVTLRRMLRLFPRLIIHSEYDKRPLPLRQWVYDYFECPDGGSLLDLAEMFFTRADMVLGTNYFKYYVSRKTPPARLLMGIAHVSTNHHLGCVIFDEIQKLDRRRTKGIPGLFDFFVRYSNWVGTAVVLVGSDDFDPLIEQNISMTRRAGGQGEHSWLPMDEEDMDRFSRELCKNACFDKPFQPDWPFETVLQELSGGIHDSAIKIFQKAHEDALEAGEETLSELRLRQTAGKYFPKHLRMVRIKAPHWRHLQEQKKVLGKRGWLTSKPAKQKPASECKQKTSNDQESQKESVACPTSNANPQKPTSERCQREKKCAQEQTLEETLQELGMTLPSSDDAQ